MRVLGLINARGGSKGIPRKNIRPLMGKPLIAYAIEAGLAATRVDRVVVSTDDEEIAEIARRHGAAVPFIRPPELSSDKSLQIDAVRHAIQTLEDDGDRYDAVAILQPTTPLRTADDIDGTVGVLQATGADSAISVCDVGGRHPLTCYTRDPASNMLMPLLKADQRGVLRQNFQDVLWRNGSVYVMRRDVVMEQKSLYGRRTAGYVMPEARSFNLDSLFDWDLLEGYLLLQAQRRAGGSGKAT